MNFYIFFFFSEREKSLELFSDEKYYFFGDKHRMALSYYHGRIIKWT